MADRLSYPMEIEYNFQSWTFCWSDENGQIEICLTEHKSIRLRSISKVHGHRHGHSTPDDRGTHRHKHIAQCTHTHIQPSCFNHIYHWGRTESLEHAYTPYTPNWRRTHSHRAIANHKITEHETLFLSLCMTHFNYYAFSYRKLSITFWYLFAVSIFIIWWAYFFGCFWIIILSRVFPLHILWLPAWHVMWSPIPHWTNAISMAK